MENKKELNLNQMEAITGGTSGSRNPLPPKSGCIVYKIQSGQNLEYIANTYGTTVEKIMSVNLGIITNPKFIRAGYYIYVPV